VGGGGEIDHGLAAGRWSPLPETEVPEDPLDDGRGSSVTAISRISLPHRPHRRTSSRHTRGAVERCQL